MADHDEGYVIIERRTGSFGTFVWGLLLGAGAALLFAPKSGRETRRELGEGVERLRDRAETRARELQRNVNETVDDVRRQVEDVRRQVEEGLDSARRAMESGREAARASRQDMERRVRAGFDAAREAPGNGGTGEPSGEDAAGV